jgi:phosphoribosylformylglycinamidine synthase
VDVCIKVETHNSPSALDPYGGALTGILGVNRDILGCGLGAKPIANTDVFCLAPPQWPPRSQAERLPQKLHHPEQVLAGVHRGIKDGGNKSGIPTVNGALVFDRDFAGKPLIFCGSVGVLPHHLPDGRASSIKSVKPGDHILCAGGRIGKDGIHGATMSSLHLTEDSPTSAVQIGDPLTQKKLLDFTLEARDLGLFNCITDNGAGGLSSSIGELAALAPGARIDLARAGVKYPGLLPYELLISESQERMTYGVAPEKVNEFLSLATRRGVEAWDLGEFTANGQLEISYEGKILAALDLHFLHESLPVMKLRACFEGPQSGRGWGEEELGPLPQDLKSMLLEILATDNVRSKEALVRQYDHEVLGATVQTPFYGPMQQGPSDAAVISLAPYGGLEQNAIAISCGLNPKLAHYDTYLMAENAVDEAIRNIVACGASPHELVLVDNFCWPDPLVSADNPDGAHKLGQLVRCAAGLYDAAVSFRAPFVSGKDSMKNDFVGKYADGRPVKISVPPTVLITALARLPDSSRRVSSDFKRPGDLIFLVGKPGQGLACSEFSGRWQLKDTRFATVPTIDLPANQKLYHDLHGLMAEGLIASCHVVSDGGLLACLSESAFAGELGCTLTLADEASEGWDLLNFCFNEAGGRLVVSIARSDRTYFETALAAHPLLCLGEVSAAQHITMYSKNSKNMLMEIGLAEINRAWREGGNA